MDNSAALKALAATGMSAPGSQAPTVIVQPAQYADGCDPSCSLSPTPPSTLLATSQRARTCQITFKDLGAGTYGWGQGRWNADVTLLLIASNIVPNYPYVPNPLVDALNFLSQRYTYVVGCMKIIYTAGTQDQKEAASSEPLVLNHSDPFRPFEPCDPQSIYPGCNTCIGGPVIQSFNDCAMFIGPSDSIIYTIPEGVRATVTFNITSVDTVTNQVPC